MSKTSIYFRIVKAKAPHPFSGLYAIEKLWVRGATIVQKEIVKEWDNRILTEAAMGRFGGDAAFKAYHKDHHLVDKVHNTEIEPVSARTPEDFKGLTKNKFTRELKGTSKDS